MIRAGNISVPLDFDFSRLREFCAEKFGISLGEIKSAVLTKKSVDARKKSDVHFVITIDMDVRGEESFSESIRISPQSERILMISQK